MLARLPGIWPRVAFRIAAFPADFELLVKDRAGSSVADLKDAVDVEVLFPVVAAPPAFAFVTPFAMGIPEHFAASRVAALVLADFLGLSGGSGSDCALCSDLHYLSFVNAN